MNFKKIIENVSLLGALTSIIMLSSVVVSFIYEEKEVALKLLQISLTVTIICLVAFYKSRQGKSTKVKLVDALVSVFVAWIAVGFISALPYIFITNTSFTNAIFEAISGITTTGFSILPTVEDLPKGVLFWRAMTNWYGGMGIVILGMALFRNMSEGGIQLFKTESAGYSNEGMNVPIYRLVKSLWILYTFMTLLLAYLLWALDMPIFEAVCHAMATMATGGFSVKNDSIMSYNELCKVAISIFMLLSAINFLLHLSFLKGKTSVYFKDEELRFYVIMILVAVGLVFLNVNALYSSSSSALVDAFFQVSTIVSCTGFGSTDFDQWPYFSKALLFFLMFTGGCSGSTAGGIKISRFIVVLKVAFSQILTTIQPHKVQKISLNKMHLNSDKRDRVISFCILYLVVWCIASILVSYFDNVNFETSFSAVLSSLGNVGVGLGKVGPTWNCEWMSDASTWVLSSCMLIGRLEIFTIFVLLSPSLWTKNT